jgi:alpha-glucoside transport system substrate-binding protein
MRRTHRRRSPLLVALALALATTVLAGCGSGSGGDDETVEIWMSVDQPVFDGLKETMQEKAKKAGIKVKLSKVTDINTLIMTKIQANDAPDSALIPQPGVVATIVNRHKAFPLDDVVDMSALKDNMLPGSLDAGTVDGKLYGLLVSANVKSLVFYPKKAWDKAGYPIPESIDELNALTKQIKADGNTPWCFGIESDTATGWPATDWFEELVMKYGGADKYNDWVDHKIKFDSDLVRQAAEEFSQLLLTEGNVPGGRKAIVATNFGDAENTMWNAKPGCWMEKQGSFITAFFPPDVVKNFDSEVGVFGFPPATAGEKAPVLGGGDMATLLNDSDAAKKAMKLLSETDVGAAAAKNGSSFLSPHTDFDASLYTNPLTKKASEVANAGSALLFDGSDQMPGEVGAGSFWKEVTAWILGNEDLDTMLKEIDQSWPDS